MSKYALITIICAVVAAAAVAVAVSASPAAAGGTPCWRELINDWYDGRIDKTYPAHCYREAQKRVPEDAEAYSDLPSDLQRGLTAALAGRGSGGTPPGPNTPVRPLAGLGRDAARESKGNEDDPGVAGEQKESLLDRLAPANADSIPIPLLVLAALAVLLLITAVASYVARRWQTSRAPATASPQPRDSRR